MKKTQIQETVLLKELQLGGQISLHEAMKKLSLSESTARRLFMRMEKKGLAIRGHGVISLPNGMYNYYNYAMAKGIHIEEKRKIAEKAVKMIHDGDSIFLDSGTTVFLFSLALNEALKQGKIRNIKVFTNSFMILDNINQNVNVNLVGGEYRPHRKDFCGYITEKTIKEFHYTKCIMGADGYSEEHGFTTTDFDTARICEVAISRSDAVIILMDSNKFDNTAAITYSDGSNISAVVVDNGIKEADKKRLLNKGLAVIVAEND